METVEELRSFLTEATETGVWGGLLDRGAAWAIMRVEGKLPADAPPLGATIETNLAEHGFSLLRAALAFRESGQGEPTLIQRSFEKAANAFESLVRNGAAEAPERGFFRVIAGAAYHLAGFSAIAYSLFSEHRDGQNTTIGEDALVRLILRDLNALRELTRAWLLNETNSDVAITGALQNEDIDVEEAVAAVLNSTICAAMAFFDFGLQTGERSLVERARVILGRGLKLARDEGAVSHWWIIRLCFNLIDDLWAHSLYMNLPEVGPDGSDETYAELRKLFIVSLYGRKSAEVELWPSQRLAARRSADLTDDLVVALPTSAGKTRIAEIAALMTLSVNKRVLIVTPLRALSAQTERSFRKTFAPLGFSVSSLYGASGISAGDEDSLRSRNIVIATPEKLDFALRNDPSLIDDVGLIVLDEGHMIGPSEREIRYEILVQRLLKRKDNHDRRIICLSAILPEGEQLSDLTAWVRGDVAGEPIKSPWRPTRQRFGTIQWRTNAAKLSFTLNEDGPFISRFVEQMKALGQQTIPFPRNTQALTLASAWGFAGQGKRTLIFCTQRNHVESYGKAVLDLTKRGYLKSLLEDKPAIARAFEVGCEWLGEDHPAVKCLEVGVAIHHARLPNPFLREVELLLSQGVLKVTVASPTLAQGININAAVLLVPSMYRAGKMLSGEEFANVAGRAGRAFVDVEGLVLHVMFEEESWRVAKWRELVASAKSRSLRSGLIQIVAEILARLARHGVLTRADAVEYLANSRDAWIAQETVSSSDESEGDEETAVEEPLSHLVEKLDATVFGLMEALDAEAPDLPRLLDEALHGSLWERQIRREPEDVQAAHRMILETRAALIWNHSTSSSRRGHFAMGVGLDTGLILDSISEELHAFIDKADDAALSGEQEPLVEALVELARRLLPIRPFTPDDELPPGWEKLLAAWVSGAEVDEIGADKMRFIEEAFTYRLVWALEALRTRRLALGWSPDIIVGGGAAVLETGVPQYMMAILVRAGLPSRQAAIASIKKSGASFVDGAGMREWIQSEQISEMTDKPNWPSAETAALWRRFRDETLAKDGSRWKTQKSKRNLGLERPRAAPAVGIYRIEVDRETEDAYLCTPDYKRIVTVRSKIKQGLHSFSVARIVENDSRAHIEQYGVGRSTWYERPE